ncbi:MAG: biosynthetic-type acetolactate synthase large subunit [Phycisphaerae bacterium]|jgi:acetolactate synthase-1/2/3 large subunit|nr:biosynthetic-type acetolactate synthase large subunit [Phycisphaerae bacterium]
MAKTDAKKYKMKLDKGFVGACGGEIIHQILVDQGVDLIFGFPGGALIPLFDVLYDSSIELVITRHEQGAIHMAEGYSRATGKTGVAIATSGPGATNLVTGLANAYLDSTPIVAITGQVRSNLIGNDAFQEADMTGISRPITKHNFLVSSVDDLGRIFTEAFHIASTGRPGPVLIDVPVDITLNKLESPANLTMRIPGYKPSLSGHTRQIQHAAEIINASARPLLYVGGGVIHSDATSELRAVQEKGQLPTTTTLMGLGTLDESDPLALQMVGMHGSATANYAMQECDCLIAVGARFDDRVTGKLETFAPDATVVHVDIDPTSISKVVKADVPVVGDAKDILAKMVEFIEPTDRGPWLEKIADWKKRYPLEYEPDGKCIKPQAVIEKLGELTDHDAIIATGVGQHQMWAAQFYGFRKPRQIITSGGLGTMGFGVPAAIGAQFAHPEATVIDIDGDGSFSMTMVEIITAAQYKLPVKFIVLDNEYLGMVRQWQEMFFDKRYSGTVHPCPDFVKIVEGFGAKGLRVSDPANLTDALQELLDYNDGPAVLIVAVNPEENVYPMVPAGKSLHEMELGRLA